MLVVRFDNKGELSRSSTDAVVALQIKHEELHEILAVVVNIWYDTLHCLRESHFDSLMRITSERKPLQHWMWESVLCRQCSVDKCLVPSASFLHKSISIHAAACTW